MSDEEIANLILNRATDAFEYEVLATLERKIADSPEVLWAWNLLMPEGFKLKWAKDPQFHLATVLVIEKA